MQLRLMGVSQGCWSFFYKYLLFLVVLCFVGTLYAWSYFFAMILQREATQHYSRLHNIARVMCISFKYKTCLLFVTWHLIKIITSVVFSKNVM